MAVPDVRTFQAFRAGAPPRTQLGKVDARGFDFFRSEEPLSGFVQQPSDDSVKRATWARYPKPKLRRTT